MRAPVHPVYDAQVLAAAVEWRYEPARLGGVPVKFRKRIQINVARREE
jgi:outer membrane biosynthesis protein TonB